MANESLFHVSELPDAKARNRFDALVGIDTEKERIIKEARLLLNPNLITEWSNKHHGKELPLTRTFRDRAPLFIFGGDVGTGKTTLAETFGDRIARDEKIPVRLYQLSLSARGSGAVGEMTRLITEAFREVTSDGQRVKTKGKPSSAIIMIIDEADALAQSREAAQMHHEDRAGVNALIRGIDSIGIAQLPVIVVMCTNRLDALDPAIRRRASYIIDFPRPNDGHRRMVLEQILSEVEIDAGTIDKLVDMTGPSTDRPFGYTYSDLTQRLLPAIVIDAFPDKPITAELVIAAAERIIPTPPFSTEG